MRVAVIVEGHGELEASRILLRRYLNSKSLYAVKIHPILLAQKGNLLAELNPKRRRGIEYYIENARAYRPNAIVVLLDADETCLRGR